MIELTGVSKHFGSTRALDQVSLTVPEGLIFGLLGTNGAGKSTLLKILAGILKQDQGTVLYDQKPVFDSEEVKREIFYLPDNSYYPANADIMTMKNFYAGIYERFDKESFLLLLNEFGLNENSRINKLSKGMKKQMFFLQAICAGTKYILCDEVFDGLDSTVSKKVKMLIKDLTVNRKVTFIIASHDLYELEKICQTYILFHRGAVIMEDELRHIRTDIHKVQCVFTGDRYDDLGKQLSLRFYEKKGLFTTFLAEGSREEIQEILELQEAVCFEFQPLSLEEIFIYEIEKVRDVSC